MLKNVIYSLYQKKTEKQKLVYNGRNGKAMPVVFLTVSTISEQCQMPL